MLLVYYSFISAQGWYLYPEGDLDLRQPLEDISFRSFYEDGHWSAPYFDCGGGDIWMMTYTVPFFGFNQSSGLYYFKYVNF